MWYALRETVWPTAAQVDQSIKTLIGNALEALDDKSDDAGPRMATQFCCNCPALAMHDEEGAQCGHHVP